jgi:hypothetical protein
LKIKKADIELVYTENFDEPKIMQDKNGNDLRLDDLVKFNLPGEKVFRFGRLHKNKISRYDSIENKWRFYEVEK